MSPIGSVNGAPIGPSPAPPPSGGEVPNVYEAAFERFVPRPGFLRLDIEVEGGDAFVQLNESIDRTWPAPEGEEFIVREGASSIPLVRPAFGYRVRAASSSEPITVNIRAVG